MKKIYYKKEFYEDRSVALKSAEKIIPILLEFIKPKSVIDIGCGTGEFLYVLKKKGVKNILGVDGNWVNKEKLLISQESFISANLENSLNLNKKFDLVISLEVAEHLPEKKSEAFIVSLVSLSDIILFSAAVPGQGGINHLNEQFIGYWVKIFKEKGYVPIDFIRKKIWNDKEVGFYYIQNILLFVKKDTLKKNKKLEKEFKNTKESFLSIIHPRLYFPIIKKQKFIGKFVPKPIKYLISKFINYAI